MPTKLKNLKIKRVAFVDEGANPEAHMKFAKRKPQDDPEQIEAGSIDNDETKSIIKRFFDLVVKAFDKNDDPEDDGQVKKDAHTFDEVEATRKADEVLFSEFYPMLSAFSDSVYSILHDFEKDTVQKKALLEKTMSEFSDAFGKVSSSWAVGETSDDAVVKSMDAVIATRDRLTEAIEKADAGDDSQAIGTDASVDGNPETTVNDGQGDDDPPAVQKGVTDMKFNVEAMSAEDRARYEDLAKRFGTEDENTPQTEPPADNPAPADPAHDNDVIKRMSAELDELRKFRQDTEDRELLEIAKRYTLLGHKPEELAKSLKTIKAAGGDAYGNFIAGMDAALKSVEESGMFSEIGKRGGNGANGEDAWAKIETAAQEIQKSRKELSWADAIDQACIQHPELVNEYEKSRR